MASYGGNTNRFRGEWGRASQRAADAARTFSGLSQDSFATGVAKQAASGGGSNADLADKAAENVSGGLNTVFSAGSAANDMLGSTASYGLDLANRYRFGELEYATQGKINDIREQAVKDAQPSGLEKALGVVRTVASFIPGIG